MLEGGCFRFLFDLMRRVEMAPGPGQIGTLVKCGACDELQRGEGILSIAVAAPIEGALGGPTGAA
jgi:hypothetical protein